MVGAVKMYNLADGMHTGIGATGTRYSYRGIGYLADGRLQRALHRAYRASALQLPAIVLAAIVLDGQRNALQRTGLFFIGGS